MALADQTVMELVSQASGAAADGDEDRRWEIVSQLQLHGGQVALQICQDLCADARAEHRRLGVDILGQLGATGDRPARQGPFRDTATRTLLDLVREEQVAAVLSAITVAFGHLDDARAIPALARLRAHPDTDVRHGVAFALLGRPEQAALDMLIELSADPEPYVRDWATFGLARQTTADSEQLREALAARLDDSDLETRTEAIHGLATRGDPRAIPALLDALEAPWPDCDDGLIDEALLAIAAASGDERLRPYVALRAASDQGEAGTVA